MRVNLQAMRWVIWSLAILFLFYDFFLRVFPSVIVPDLMSSFHVTGAALGTLSAFYFYAYAPMQLPVGVLLDRFGARRLLIFASLVCGIGCFLFATTSHLSIAQIGRFMMGLGSAFGFVGMVYVSSHWFPKEKLGVLIGVGNSIGMLGAAGGQGPLSYAMRSYGWQEVVMGLGVVGLAIGFFIGLCLLIRSKEGVTEVGHHEKVKDVIPHFKGVMKNKQTWFNGIGALLFYMTTGTFAGLWGIPFLQENYHLSREVAAMAVSMVYIGWILGGPPIGYLSDKLKERRKVVIVSVLFTALFLCPVIYAHSLPTPLLYLFLLLVGVFSSGQLLTFTLAIELNGAKAKGCAGAVNNFIIEIGSSLMQPLIGLILDFLWRGGHSIQGARVYSVQAYKTAFTAFPLTLLLSILFFFLLSPPKKTFIKK